MKYNQKDLVDNPGTNQTRGKPLNIEKLKTIFGFMKNGSPFDVVRVSLNVASLAAAIGSVVILSVIIFNFLNGLIPFRFVAITLTVVLEIGALFLIDFSLRRTLQFTLTMVIAGNWWKNGYAATLVLLMVCLNGSQLFVTYKLGWDGRKDAMEAAMAPPVIIDPSERLSDINRQNANLYTTLSSQISTLENRMAQNRRSVRADHPGFVEKIESGNDKWGWHAGQIEKKTQALNSDLEAQAADLRSTLSGLMAQNGDNGVTLTTEITQLNDDQVINYQNRKARNEAYVGWLSVIAVSFVFIMSLILVLMKGLKNGWNWDLKESLGDFVPTLREATVGLSKPMSRKTGPELIPVAHTSGPGGAATRFDTNQQRRPVAERVALDTAGNSDGKTQPRNVVAQKPRPATSSNATVNELAFVDLRSLDKNLRIWFERSTTSAKAVTQKENLWKYQQAVTVLEPLGITYTPRPDNPTKLDRTVDKDKWDPDQAAKILANTVIEIPEFK